MSSPLKIATSPVSNTIFVGRVLKGGIWAAGKQDVTVDALYAVAEHIMAFGAPVELTCGKIKITLTATKEVKP